MVQDSHTRQKFKMDPRAERTRTGGGKRRSSNNLEEIRPLRLKAPAVKEGC